jgi:hypothetical protein
MVAWQNDHGPCVIAENLRRAFQKLFGLAVIVEGVAGEQNHVGADFNRGPQYFRKVRQTIRTAEAVVGAEISRRDVVGMIPRLNPSPLTTQFGRERETMRRRAEIPARRRNLLDGKSETTSLGLGLTFRFCFAGIL